MEFKISKEGYQKFARRRMRILIPIVAVIVLVIIFTNLYRAKADEFMYLAIILPLVVAFFGFSLYRSSRKQMNLFLSYSLTVTDSEIIREQLNTPPLTISFMEIKEIIKTKRGGFMIKGRTSADIILVPYMIDNADELEKRLQTFAPITIWTRDPWRLKYRGLLLYFLGLAALVTANTVNNMIVAGLAGLLAIGLLIWLYITIRRSKNVTTNVRRRAWICLVIAAFIAYTLIMRIVGFPFTQ
jgi:hypothetical protein